MPPGGGEEAGAVEEDQGEAEESQEERASVGNGIRLMTVQIGGHNGECVGEVVLLGRMGDNATEEVEGIMGGLKESNFFFLGGGLGGGHFSAIRG